MPDYNEVTGRESTSRLLLKVASQKKKTSEMEKKKNFKNMLENPPEITDIPN